MSEASRRDILRFYPEADPERVQVVQNAIDEAILVEPSPEEMERVRERYQIRGRFVLYAGNIKPHKNLDRLIAAFGLLKQRPGHEDLKLLIIGDEVNKYGSLRRSVEAAGVRQDVRFFGFVPDTTLSALYRLASVFAFPSLYEGFGLPPLEAMACGTPVVTSRISSLPEVVGDAAVLVDPVQHRGHRRGAGQRARERGRARGRRGPGPGAREGVQLGALRAADARGVHAGARAFRPGGRGRGSALKVALVHDWLTGMRGGEKVLLSLCRLFPDAPIFTLLHVQGAVDPEIERRDIRTTFVQRLPSVGTRYRHYLPLFPAAAATIDLPGFDLVVSSSHCVVKSVRVDPGAVHVCYCHTPMRYVWDRYDDYFGPAALGRALRPMVALGRQPAARLGRATAAASTSTWRTAATSRAASSATTAGARR